MRRCIVTIMVTLILATGFWAMFPKRFTVMKPDGTETFVGSGRDLDPQILCLGDSAIIFAANDSTGYSLFQYNTLRHVISPIASSQNLTSPFLFKGALAALRDHEGDEHFQPNIKALQRLIGVQKIHKIYSFGSGDYLIVQFKNSPNIYFFDLKSGITKVVGAIREKFHGVSYNEKSKFFAISFDDSLICFDGNALQRTTINQPPGEKLNPYIHGNHIYYVNNFTSEYYKIYRADISKSNQSAFVMHETNSDLRMPKVDENEKLYYLELVKSEYLLRGLNTETGEIEFITNKGVTYTYQPLRPGEIAYVYSDPFLPKTLMHYKAKADTTLNVSSSEILHDVSVKYMNGRRTRSDAYVIAPPKGTAIIGVALYFHPGIRSDFSPRWDPILYNLALNGLYIIAPNYPMSTGYGKTHYNAQISEAVQDLIKWKGEILDDFDYPLYYLSASSGNILMEFSLSQNCDNVQAAASLFGTTTMNCVPNVSVPTLHILGENDPVVPYEERVQSLGNCSDISVKSYTDEGHWFRKSRNMRSAVTEIIRHFKKN